MESHTRLYPMLKQLGDPEEFEEETPCGGADPATDPLVFGTQAYTLQELEKMDLKNPTELVENIVFKGEVVTIVARPKTGKTRLAQQLAVAVAHGPGVEFLGQRVLERTPVLYVDLESQPINARERLRKIAGDKWEEIKERVYIYCVNSMAQAKVGLAGDNLVNLMRMVQETKAGLLIIDTWRLVFQGKENDAQSVVSNLRNLHALHAVNPNLAIVILHHLRKAGTDGPSVYSLRHDPHAWLEQASGSLAFIAHTDASFGMEREESAAGEIYVFGGIRRSGQAPMLILKSDEETLRFELLDDLEIRAQTLLTPKQYELWGRLPGRFTWGDAEQLAGGANGKSLLAGLLRRAFQNNLVDKGDRKGEYVKVKADKPENPEPQAEND